MTAANVLLALVEAGAVLWLDGDRLRFRAPRGALGGDLDARSRACRPALVALLRAGAVLPPDLAAWPADERDAYEERAGIRQFEGGLPREVAEREAERDVRLARLRDFIARNALVVEPPAGDAVAGTGQGTARTGGP
jgi:hypothetical protein